MNACCFAALDFGPNDLKVILKLRHGYVPKVISTLFNAQVITLSTLLVSEEAQSLHLLCPVWALRVYVKCASQLRQSEQHFVCFGGHTKRLPVMKQKLSHWIVDTIGLTYASLGLQCPISVRAHSTRQMASSWTWSRGISISDICTAASWSSLSTFVRYYNLVIPTLQAQNLSA